ncbi:MAG: hypothetical protein ABF608_07165 [Sporolactobacillus sp.]
MGLYTVRETREITRTALVDAESADQAILYFNRSGHAPNMSGRVDIQSNADERHVIVKEYEEADK